MRKRLSGSRVIEIVLALVGIGWLVALGTAASVLVLALWDLLAFGYCLFRWLRIRHHRTLPDEQGGQAPQWLHTLLGRRTAFVTTFVVSLIGLSAGVLILVARSISDAAQGAATVSVVLQLLAVPAAVMAWLLLHFGYADHYAHLYYQSPDEPVLSFPETDRPNLLDFAYFSITVGTSFAASDVEVRSRQVRYTVLTHGVVSFFYNLVILGIAIGVLTGI